MKTELLETQRDLVMAYRRFDKAVDPDLVESCVYQISAVKARYNYLIRAIKACCPEAVAAAACNRVSTEPRRSGLGEKVMSCEIMETMPQGGDEEYGACEEDAAWT